MLYCCAGDSVTVNVGCFCHASKMRHFLTNLSSVRLKRINFSKRTVQKVFPEVPQTPLKFHGI